MGPITYEFVQPLEGETVYSEALESRGDGVNDIVFEVEDLNTEIANLTGKGVEVALSGKLENGGAFAYFDTREKGGNIMIRLVQ